MSVEEQLLQLINGARLEDLQIAKASLASTIVIVASETKKLKDLTISAKRDGLPKIASPGT